MTVPPHADAELAAILDELARREPIFHQPAYGDDADALTTEGFFEIGASGALYERAFVVEEIARRRTAPIDDAGWVAAEFRGRRLADDLYLLHYVLDQRGRRSRRTTLWRRTPDGWKIEFHQGTLTAD